MRAVVLTGAGRAFCAGQDLGEAVPSDGSPAPDLGAIVAAYNGLVTAIRHLEKPVVAAVNGAAAGAGANIALACDLVIAAENASFIQAFVRIGLIPDNGGTFFLPRLVGLARATAMMMLGERVTAQQAKDWGMIYDVVLPLRLGEVVGELARRLATQPTRALGSDQTRSQRVTGQRSRGPVGSRGDTAGRSRAHGGLSGGRSSVSGEAHSGLCRAIVDRAH